MVNGEIFATTYNNTGFADCIGAVNSANAVNFNTLPNFCIKAVADDKYTLSKDTFEQKANLIMSMLAKEFKLNYNKKLGEALPDYYLYHGSEYEVHWKNAYVLRNAFYADERSAVKVKGPDGNYYDKVYIEIVVPMNKKHGCFHVNMRVLGENYNLNTYTKGFCFDIDLPSSSCKREDGFYSNANFSFSTMNSEQMVNMILSHKKSFTFMYNIATKSDFKIVKPTENTKRVLKTVFDGVCSETEKNDLTSICKQIKKQSEITVYGSGRKISCDELLRKHNVQKELCLKTLSNLQSVGLKDIGVILTETEMRTICSELCSSNRVELNLFIGATKTGKTSFPYISFSALPIIAIEYVKENKNFVVLSCKLSDFNAPMAIIPADQDIQSLIDNMVTSIKELNNYYLKEARRYFDRIAEISDTLFDDMHTYFEENDYVILQENKLKNQIMINGDNDDKVAIRYRVYIDMRKIFIQVQGKSNGITLNQTFDIPLSEDEKTDDYWFIFEAICKKFSLNPYRRIEKVIDILKKDFPDMYRDTDDVCKWNFKIQNSEYSIIDAISGENVDWDVHDTHFAQLVHLNVPFKENINTVAAQLRQSIKQYYIENELMFYIRSLYQSTLKNYSGTFSFDNSNKTYSIISMNGLNRTCYATENVENTTINVTFNLNTGDVLKEVKLEVKDMSNQGLLALAKQLSDVFLSDVLSQLVCYNLLFHANTEGYTQEWSVIGKEGYYKNNATKEKDLTFKIEYSTYKFNIIVWTKDNDYDTKEFNVTQDFDFLEMCRHYVEFLNTLVDLKESYIFNMIQYLKGLFDMPIKILGNDTYAFGDKFKIHIWQRDPEFAELMCDITYLPDDYHHTTAYIYYGTMSVIDSATTLYDTAKQLEASV